MQQLGWTRVDVGGTVQALFGSEWGPPLVVAGEDDGQPLLAEVTRSETRPLPEAAEGRSFTPPDGGYQAVQSNGDVIALVGREDPSAVLLHHEWIPYAPQHVQDEVGRAAAWVSPVLDGEGHARVVGAVRTADGWRLHAWQAEGDDDWLALDSGEQLQVTAEPGTGTLLTATTEVTVVVAGAVAALGAADDGEPQVWSIDDMPELSGGRWQRHPLATAPDALTDLVAWDLDWWVAGHREGRPVVHDGAGAHLPVPDTRLDTAHPLVLVAGMPVSRPLVLATQSVDGPVVWLDEGGSWSRTPAPPGRLSAAQLVDQIVYVVVDGALWFRDLPPAARRP